MSIPPTPRLPARLLRHAKVLPSREEILAYLPADRVFVEIGVAFGDFSKLVLERCQPRQLIAIDFFDIERNDTMWGKPIQHWLGDKTHAEFYADRFSSEIADGKVRLMIGNAFDQISALPDNSVDIFYVDAGHSYDELKEQLEVIRLKVREDGFIVMNDYTFNDYNSDVPAFYGVIQATHEFMIAHDWEMIYLALHPEMFCDVVLRRCFGEF